MLIKEYHVLLPMSVDEYQVAQLYMIQVGLRAQHGGCCGAEHGGLGAAGVCEAEHGRLWG